MFTCGTPTGLESKKAFQLSSVNVLHGGSGLDPAVLMPLLQEGMLSVWVAFKF